MVAEGYIIYKTARKTKRASALLMLILLGELDH